MPTGYTAELMDKGQDFRTFALICARAFGACIMQRDDPMNEPPKKQGTSDYHAKALLEAQARLATLKAMTPEQQQSEGSRLRMEAVRSICEYREKGLAENARLDSMVAQVRAWEPPTEEHRELKSFMLQQIETSRNDVGYDDKRVVETQEKTPEAYFVEAVSSTVRSVAYHTSEQAKEAERNSGRNEWIEQLYASLPK